MNYVKQLGGGLLIALLLCGCTTSRRIDNTMEAAYNNYDDDNCEAVMQNLSEADRLIRKRRYLQSEISLMRGLCLERQGYFMDALETYRFILSRYPQSEYGFRARARIRLLEGQALIKSGALYK